jgi:protein SCO1/2
MMKFDPKKLVVSSAGMLGVATVLLYSEGALPAWTSLLDKNGWRIEHMFGSDKQVGERFPNVVLTTQDGKKVRLYDDLLKGKTVAVNTFFAGCSDVCPLGTAKMLELQRLFGDRVGKDIFFYSISVDPHDTPAAMKEYAQRYRVGPGWLFLTGKEKDVQLATRALGLGTLQATNPRDQHSTTLTVGNEPSGQWMKNSSIDNPRFVAATIETFFGWQATVATRDYGDARQINLTNGQYLFQNACMSCHNIGTGDKIGPDLLGVSARRDRQWLERFILAPDEVLASGDALANGLLKQYNGIRMPNLGLTPGEVSELLTYIDDKSALHSKNQVASPAAAMPKVSATARVGADTK